jgi:predicted nuclease of predicted toxin-antitoxin system
MRFIIDAQLPRKLAAFLTEKGYYAIHTLDLPKGNKTTDTEISDLSIKEKLIVISKDIDFYDRFMMKLEPYKLLYLSTGNITNKKLLHIFENNLDKIIEEVSFYSVIELTADSIIIID